jgi:AcrR family transcriptional regulator
MTSRRSTRRTLQAQQTREEIIAAARRLFAQRGYAATSMADVAREAGVVVQTIYASVGPKQALLRELNDLIDTEAGVAELAAQIAATQDPAQVLVLVVRLTRQVVDRCGDIVRAIHAGAGSEPDIAAVLAEGRDRHREGMAAAATQLATAHALTEGIGAEQAGQLLAVLTSNEVWFQLQRDFGMSLDEAEQWILTMLRRVLLRP